MHTLTAYVRGAMILTAAAAPVCSCRQADGNCFFRSVMDQLEVRTGIMNE